MRNVRATLGRSWVGRWWAGSTLAASAGRLRTRLGLDDVDIGVEDRWRALVLLAVSALCALLIVDYARAPEDALIVGDIAPRTVKAPFTFTYADHAAHERQRDEARQASLPVYLHRADLVDERIAQIAQAFDAGRESLVRLGGNTGPDGPHPPQLTEELRLHVVEAFLEPLRVQLPESDVVALMDSGFSPKAEQLARELTDGVMRDQLIVGAKDQLPPDRRPLRIIHLAGGEQREETMSADGDIRTPEEARQRIGLSRLESNVPSGPEANAAASLARALVTPNLQHEALESAKRSEAAANSVPLPMRTVKRGQILLRTGEVVTQSDLDVYRALQEHRGETDLAMELLAITLFLALLFASLYHFASTWLAGFTTRVRDVASVGALLVLTAMFARGVAASSEGVAQVVGWEAEPRSVWFLVPLAGAAMLVRLLLGVQWTVVFTVAASIVCGLVMEQQALLVAYFVISGVAAASAVEHTRERIAVVRAGAVVGVVNAVAVLLIHLVQLYVVEGELSLATTIRPFWSMIFAFAGGITSAFLVLGLVPVFESVGFVTDYRLMELANLNHPLLRQLMLRAPGSYHHSVIVGTLAEAGCQAIGANALLAKVAAYFHDIGKARQPQYFVENQQNGINKHATLDPYTSAHIIIAHVTDGGRMAKEHALPQPIVDNIYMHHGTGILQYFYAAAASQAADPDAIDPDAFRYPGPKPNTREAGVIMLADKVEAATRTLKVPDEHNIRSMISRIVNSVVADGQFTECPLTFEEIHTIAETFATVLVGIYHQRVEYPHTADLSRASAGQGAAIAPADAPTLPPTAPEAPVDEPSGDKGGIPEPAAITLDLTPNQRALAAACRPQTSQHTNRPDGSGPGPWAADGDDAADVVDYEALDFLPRGEVGE
jgi:cyclic-di-AMP phosphodiesterase PgpH